MSGKALSVSTYLMAPRTSMAKLMTVLRTLVDCRCVGGLARRFTFAKRSDDSPVDNDPRAVCRNATAVGRRLT